MRRFRVTWSFAGRSASYVIVTATLEIARETAKWSRLPGIQIVSVEPDDGDDGAGVAATLAPTPPQPGAAASSNLTMTPQRA